MDYILLTDPICERRETETGKNRSLSLDLYMNEAVPSTSYRNEERNEESPLDATAKAILRHYSQWNETKFLSREKISFHTKMNIHIRKSCRR